MGDLKKNKSEHVIKVIIDDEEYIIEDGELKNAEPILSQLKSCMEKFYEIQVNKLKHKEEEEKYGKVPNLQKWNYRS